MNKPFLLKHYLKYLFLAHHDQGHGIHSPFIYQFITDLLEDERYFYAFEKIEERRSELLRSSGEVKVKDYGSGKYDGKLRKVKHIVRRSALPSKFGELLFKLVDFFSANTVFELGTSTGISTSYLASANSRARVYTFEGCTETAKIAKETFSKLKLHNVFLRTGTFDEQLPIALSKVEHIDVAFIDGNHTYEATIKYFNMLLKKLHPKSILIFDDIHWSKGMYKAWKEIRIHPEVVLTIDLFFVGLVFFRKGMAKQDVVIRF